MADEVTARGEEGPTEVAQALAALVPSMPEKTASDLKRLLAQNLAAPAVGEQREGRLGLLVDLISTGTGEIPAVKDYEDARKEAKEEWPTASTLLRSFGTWLAVVRAAIRLYFDGTRARVPTTLQHAGGGKLYSRDEVLAAIRRCRDSLADWPSASEYQEWGRLSRAAARRAGLVDPRLPTMKPLRRYFGTFENAVEAAKRIGG